MGGVEATLMEITSLFNCNEANGQERKSGILERCILITIAAV